ncbi:Dyp-type peroxidase [Micrococcales bacterium 31B]|nr:Dyp-type peroxidase [Micrococcales bacterium 31B]
MSGGPATPGPSLPGPSTPGPEPEAPRDQAEGVSRRTLFWGAGTSAVVGAALGAGAVAGGGALGAFGRDAGSATLAASATDGASGNTVNLSQSVAFFDEAHPAGIETPPQGHCIFATFTLSETATAKDLQVLLARWTAAIGQLSAGKAVGSVEPARADAVPRDTGEAQDLAPASLTVTVGLGPRVFGEQFGLAAQRPALLADLPTLPGDDLDPAFTGGDLSVQACSDDPQVTYHAIRNLARIAGATATTHWVVMGFGRASAGEGQTTPRNLLGFKDGTRNVSTPSDFDDHVWLREADWMTGGTYQVARKIRMHIENWDLDRISDQQLIFGRTKLEGAPLSGEREKDEPDFAKTGADGAPLIDPTSHIALAAHENNNGVKILRRSYNYTDGLNAQGLLDAGLLFIAYLNDPANFVTLQRKLGSFDLLNEYIQHIGSAVFAVPPAPPTGGYIGQALFA